MNTCKICKHWEGNRELDVDSDGPCSKVAEFDIYDEDDTYMYGCEVWTPAGFGCNKWEGE